MIRVRDSIGQHLELPSPPKRVVSLVPSETSSLVDLVGIEPLVGRTDFCVEPETVVDEVPTVGGTKGFDLGTVLALEPDLVLANKEENSRPQVQSLIDAGLRVHVSFPCTVAESALYLEQLCRLFDRPSDESSHVKRCRQAAASAMASSSVDLVPVFVPIWREPWMTFDGGAYASDVLRASGAINVFEGRVRRYPLAADLGKTAAWSEERVGERDTRYPRIRLEEIIERGARLVLLPDEPYAFGEKDLDAFRQLSAGDALQVEFVDGKDLFWYGTRAASAVAHLRTRFDRFRQR